MYRLNVRDFIMHRYYTTKYIHIYKYTCIYAPRHNIRLLSFDLLRRPSKLQNICKGNLAICDVQSAKNTTAHAKIRDAFVGRTPTCYVEKDDADGCGDKIEEFPILAEIGLSL